MRHFPKYLTGSVSVMAMGWAAYVLAQPPLGTQPPFNPATSVQPALPSAQPAYPGTVPARGTAQRGMVVVPHGLVTAIDDIKVPARDAGALVKLYVKGGEIVPGNVILGEIDERDTLAKMRIAQGELDAATAQFDSKAEIEAAKKGYEVANAEYLQNFEIRKTNPNALSIMELRRSEFQKDRAQAQIKVAETDNLVAGLTAKMKQAQLDATGIELGKKKIVSPIQGQIVEVYRHSGEWVQPGDPVLRLVRLDRVRVEGFVYAAEAGPNEVDGKPVSVKVYLPGNKETTLSGRIDFVSPLIEGSGRNRQYRVWAEVENQVVDNHFVVQPGASAELHIDILAAKLPAPQKEAPPTFEAPAAPAAPAPAATAPALNPPASGVLGPRTEAPPATTNVETLKPELPGTNNAAAAPVAPMPMPAVAPMPAAPAPRPAVTPASATKGTSTKSSGAPRNSNTPAQR